MENVCVLCQRRVSEWMMASHKCKFVGDKLVHNACLIDYKLKYGRDYQPNNDHEADGA